MAKFQCVSVVDELSSVVIATCATVGQANKQAEKYKRFARENAALLGYDKPSYTEVIVFPSDVDLGPFLV